METLFVLFPAAVATAAVWDLLSRRGMDRTVVACRAALACMVGLAVGLFVFAITRNGVSLVTIVLVLAATAFTLHLLDRLLN